MSCLHFKNFLNTYNILSSTITLSLSSPLATHRPQPDRKPHRRCRGAQPCGRPRGQHRAGDYVVSWHVNDRHCAITIGMHLLEFVNALIYALPPPTHAHLYVQCGVGWSAALTPPCSANPPAWGSSPRLPLWGASPWVSHWRIAPVQSPYGFAQKMGN